VPVKSRPPLWKSIYGKRHCTTDDCLRFRWQRMSSVSRPEIHSRIHPRFNRLTDPRPLFHGSHSSPSFPLPRDCHHSYIMQRDYLQYLLPFVYELGALVNVRYGPDVARVASGRQWPCCLKAWRLREDGRVREWVYLVVQPILRKIIYSSWIPELF